MSETHQLGKTFSTAINYLLVLLQKHTWPGKHRFYIWMCRRYPSHLLRHKINQLDFILPVDEWCFWLENGPNNYYLDEFVPFFEHVQPMDGGVAFFDLGADIGTVSALANQYCNNIEQFFAFEPNPKSFKLLSYNLASFPPPTLCQNMAVSDFNGSVNFTGSAERSIDHEGSIDVETPGDTCVVSLDDWVRKNNIQLVENVVLKIDVEGQEEQAMRGARNLITASKRALVLLEIHPEVLEKTSTSPEQLFETLESIRSVDWLVPMIGNCSVDRNKPFFQQFERKQYDLIGVLK